LKKGPKGIPYVQTREGRKELVSARDWKEAGGGEELPRVVPG
jgi:hypothetical protein